MYVYLSPTISGEPFTVGFYDPAGKWHPESDHNTANQAAWRVQWLNGVGTRKNQNDNDQT